MILWEVLCAEFNRYELESRTFSASMCGVATDLGGHHLQRKGNSRKGRDDSLASETYDQNISTFFCGMIS
jgi:hypothetical protein